MGLDRPQHDGDGVGLIIIGGAISAGSNGLDHRLLVGIAFSSDEPLDRADRHALVGDFVLLAPSAECREESAVGVASVGSGMAANFLTNDALDVPSGIPEYKACAVAIEKI